jgi:uncharacterized membrane protein YjjB (DUF3815 family)
LLGERLEGAILLFRETTMAPSAIFPAQHCTLDTVQSPYVQSGNGFWGARMRENRAAEKKLKGLLPKRVKISIFHSGLFPIAAGMLAHAARWALITVAGGSAVTGALVACMLVSVIVTPVVDRLHLPFAVLAFSAVVSMIPGFFLFNAAAGLVELVSIGPSAPAALLTSIATSGATAFLIIMAMTFGLILPRMLFEHFLPPSV